MRGISDHPGQLAGGHVQPAREQGYGQAQRMLDPRGVLRSPGVLVQRSTRLGSVVDHRVDRRQQPVIPVLIARVQEMGGPLGDDLPKWPLDAPKSGQGKVGIDLAAGLAEQVAKLRDQLAAKTPDGSVTNRFHGGSPAPLLHVPPQLLAVGAALTASGLSTASSNCCQRCQNRARSSS